jgi:hypothetical protein
MKDAFEQALPSPSLRALLAQCGIPDEEHTRPRLEEWLRERWGEAGLPRTASIDDLARAMVASLIGPTP